MSVEWAERQRDTNRLWIEKNHSDLVRIYKMAYYASTERERLKLVEEIALLPGIPKANNPDQRMRAEYFITPVFFMLDRDIKFPLINGNRGVRRLLRALKVSDSGLVAQYKALVSLYGKGGIEDAADLDQIKGDISDFLTTENGSATKKLLERKSVDGQVRLELKDEQDVEAIKTAGTIVQRRVHNKLTNQLMVSLRDYTLLEGKNDACMYDVLVKNYDKKGNDLLIEVKSSVESPHVRMAVGQLFSYWHNLMGDLDPHLAVLLPAHPGKDIEKFLDWMGVGLMWYENNRLHICDGWLGRFHEKKQFSITRQI